MPARTGQQYIDGLRAKPREVWIGTELVTDPTRFPGFQGGMRSVARLYDMQHEPALQDELTYLTPSGERVGMSFLAPRSALDLQRRREMMARWAHFSGGMMGRTPDYLNSSLMAMAAAAEFFARGDPRFGQNMVRYFEYVRDHDLVLTHALINPQVNRAAGASGQPEPFLAAGIVEEGPDGLVIRGARMLATLGPLADELLVFPSTTSRGMAEDDRYAFAFAVPCTAPGLKFLCRNSFAGASPADSPLASRFEEMDALIVFDDVLVPWERVFIHRNPALCGTVFSSTDAVVHMAHQVVIKNVVKAEFLIGVASLLAEMIAIDQFPHVQEKIAEMIVYLETMKACLRAAEADAELDEWGVFTPAWWPLNTARNAFPAMYPRMVEILQLLGAGGLMAMPSAGLFDTDVRGDLESYLQAARSSAGDRMRLFKLAWDIACSSFGSRQVLYERFFFGDPVRMASAVYHSYDRVSLMDRVREFIGRDEE
ncbi:MAG: 4-hydroxyphenylacetate 3-monooxygenase, oxygenase component [Chloroflexota bacterium]|nr:4-hydroxyphenylacetate 3-monooxygenase, oxygenase component [Chloroflexota bacterium]